MRRFNIKNTTEKIEVRFSCYSTVGEMRRAFKKFDATHEGHSSTVNKRFYAKYHERDDGYAVIEIFLSSSECRYQNIYRITAISFYYASLFYHNGADDFLVNVGTFVGHVSAAASEWLEKLPGLVKDLKFGVPK